MRSRKRRPARISFRYRMSTSRIVPSVSAFRDSVMRLVNRAQPRSWADLSLLRAAAYTRHVQNERDYARTGPGADLSVGRSSQEKTIDPLNDARGVFTSRASRSAMPASRHPARKNAPLVLATIYIAVATVAREGGGGKEVRWRFFRFLDWVSPFRSLGVSDESSFCFVVENRLRRWDTFCRV